MRHERGEVLTALSSGVGERWRLVGDSDLGPEYERDRGMVAC